MRTSATLVPFLLNLTSCHLRFAEITKDTKKVRTCEYGALNKPYSRVCISANQSSHARRPIIWVTSVHSIHMSLRYSSLLFHLILNLSHSRLISILSKAKEYHAVIMAFWYRNNMARLLSTIFRLFMNICKIITVQTLHQ